jgi:hypothetical protein
MHRWWNLREGRFLLLQLTIMAAFLGLAGWTWCWQCYLYTPPAGKDWHCAPDENLTVFLALVAGLYMMPFAGWQARLVQRRQRAAVHWFGTSIMVLLMSLFPIGVIIYEAIIISLAHFSSVGP